jgi:hypothetical protein
MKEIEKENKPIKKLDFGERENALSGNPAESFLPLPLAPVHIVNILPA